MYNSILSYYSLLNIMKNKSRKQFNINNFKLNITEIENGKNHLFTSKNNMNNKDLNINNNNLYEEYNLSNLKLEHYENSLNDNEYIFFVSDDEYIHLYKMKSYVLFCYLYNDLKQPKIYYFDFSFYQMMVLFYKSKYDNLVQFLQRLIKVNKKTKKIYLDYYYFNSFKLMNNKQVDYQFKESYLLENFNKSNYEIDTTKKIIQNNNINSNNDNSNNPNNITEKELILKVSNPKFISVSIKKNIVSKDNENIEEKWNKKE